MGKTISFLNFAFILLFTLVRLSHNETEDYPRPTFKDDPERSKEEEKEMEKEVVKAEKLDIGIPEGEKSAFDWISQVNQIETPGSLSAADKRSMANNTVESVLKKSVPVSEQLYEGDEELDKDDLDLLTSSINTTTLPEEEASKRNAVVWKKKMWLTREIPYYINHPGTSGNSPAAVKAAIEDALRSISEKSCLKFRPRITSDKNWIEYYKGAGCHSGIGRRYYETAATMISLGELCISKGLIQHETLHALGFYHEQSRPDRDTFVKVQWENIRSDMESNFQRHKNYEGDTQGIPYDYKSVMHYSQTAFTVNGKPVLLNKFDPYMPLGGNEMTETDFFKLNTLYQCRDETIVGWSDWTDWSPCYKTFTGSCERNRQRMCMSKDTSKCPGVNEYGVEETVEKCDSKKCEVEELTPGWGIWGPWSDCSSQCGMGERIRRRKCDNPPSSGDNTCHGSPSQTRLCRFIKCSMSWYDTNFEKGFGMWTQSKSDGFDWTRTYGPSPSGDSGPQRDHSNGKGYYLVAVSGTGSFSSDMSGKTAVLVSYELPAGFGKRCLNFFYQMNGKHVDRLYISLETKSKSTIFLWSKTGHQGNAWLPGAANLPALEEPYRIKIEARMGYAPYADIAIDDVYIDDGKCLPYTDGWKEYNSVYCFLWRGSGYCYKSSKWMLSNCCEACSGMDDCKDESDSCKKWAEEGWCASQSWFWKIWMWLKCCNACRDCIDRNPQCPYWSTLEGECKKDWMKANCKTSCKICVS